MGMWVLSRKPTDDGSAQNIGICLSTRRWRRSSIANDEKVVHGSLYWPPEAIILYTNRMAPKTIIGIVFCLYNMGDVWNASCVPQRSEAQRHEVGSCSPCNASCVPQLSEAQRHEVGSCSPCTFYPRGRCFNVPCFFCHLKHGKLKRLKKRRNAKTASVS